VKNWQGGSRSAWQDTRDQLTCYVDQLNAAYGGTVVKPGADLVAPGGILGFGSPRWSTAYPDNQGQIWCVWADQKTPNILPSGPGLIFFAQQNDPTLPSDVKGSTLGCDQGTEDYVKERCVAELMKNDLPCAITDGGVRCQGSSAAPVLPGLQTSSSARVPMHAGRPLTKVAGGGIPWSVRAPQPRGSNSGLGRVVRRATLVGVRTEAKNHVFETS
jgi:hypothetical protein